MLQFLAIFSYYSVYRHIKCACCIATFVNIFRQKMTNQRPDALFYADSAPFYFLSSHMHHYFSILHINICKLIGCFLRFLML